MIDLEKALLTIRLRLDGCIARNIGKGPITDEEAWQLVAKTEREVSDAITIASKLQAELKLANSKLAVIREAMDTTS